MTHQELSQCVSWDGAQLGPEQAENFLPTLHGLPVDGAKHTAEVGLAPDAGGGGVGVGKPSVLKVSLGRGHRVQEGGDADREHAEIASLEWFVP